MRTFIIAAISVDGFIGRNSGHTSMEWTSAEDKKLFVRLTKEAGTIVMGSRTFATIGKALPGRRTIVLTSNPDSITTEGVEATSESAAELLDRLEEEGVETVAICGGASVYAQFMAAGVVDELYITIEPIAFGSGVPLFSGELEVDLHLLDTEKLNDETILLHYNVM